MRGDGECGAGMKKRDEPGELWRYRPGEVLWPALSSWAVYNQSPWNSVSSLKRLSETTYPRETLRLK